MKKLLFVVCLMAGRLAAQEATVTPLISKDLPDFFYRPTHLCCPRDGPQVGQTRNPNAANSEDEFCVIYCALVAHLRIDVAHTCSLLELQNALIRECSSDELLDIVLRYTHTLVVCKNVCETVKPQDMWNENYDDRFFFLCNNFTIPEDIFSQFQIM